MHGHGSLLRWVSLLRCEKSISGRSGATLAPAARLQCCPAGAKVYRSRAAVCASRRRPREHRRSHRNELCRILPGLAASPWRRGRGYAASHTPTAHRMIVRCPGTASDFLPDPRPAALRDLPAAGGRGQPPRRGRAHRQRHRRDLGPRRLHARHDRPRTSWAHAAGQAPTADRDFTAVIEVASLPTWWWSPACRRRACRSSCPHQAQAGSTTTPRWLRNPVAHRARNPQRAADQRGARSLQGDPGRDDRDGAGASTTRLHGPPRSPCCAATRSCARSPSPAPSAAPRSRSADGDRGGPPDATSDAWFGIVGRPAVEGIGRADNATS